MHLRSLHTRLALGLLAILWVTGMLSVATTLSTTRLYLQEMDQQLDMELAQRLVADLGPTLFDAAGDADEAGFAALDAAVGLLDPRLEVHWLALDGGVELSDARGAAPPPGAAVAKEPIRIALTGDVSYPLLGGDPRRPGKTTLFAVAPLQQGGSTVGYLYLVRPSAQRPGVLPWLSDLQGSYILRLSLRNAVIYLSVVLLAGYLLFGYLTRPLRRLATRMQKVLNQDAQSEPAAAPRDEVASLQETFDEMAQRIEEQMREIDRMAGLRNELISNISHDLRTPIASLQGYLDTLMLKEDVLSQDERDEYLQIALNQSERLGKLVDELFEITKLENFAIEPQMERFHLAELAQDVVQGFQLRAEQQRVVVEAELNPDLSPVYVDVRLMERALENLIGNALRFTPPGGSVRVVFEETPFQIKVRVIDTGRGISADDLPHIFDRFYQARFHGGKTSREGAGLGLAITRRIVELHQSTLEVQSTVGVGSTFSFSLPVAPRTHQIVGLDTEGLDAARVDALRRHLESRG